MVLLTHIWSNSNIFWFTPTLTRRLGMPTQLTFGGFLRNISGFSENVSRYLARVLFLSCGVGGVNEKNLENKKRRCRRFPTRLAASGPLFFNFLVFFRAGWSVRQDAFFCILFWANKKVWEKQINVVFLQIILWRNQSLTICTSYAKKRPVSRPFLHEQADFKLVFKMLINQFRPFFNKLDFAC